MNEYSNCCTANRMFPESDLCSHCKEHADFEEFNNIKDLVSSINKFDNYYEMADDPRVYAIGLASEIAIDKELTQLTKEEVSEVKNSLSTVGKAIWVRYFNKI